LAFGFKLEIFGKNVQINIFVVFILYKNVQNNTLHWPETHHKSTYPVGSNMQTVYQTI